MRPAARTRLRGSVAALAALAAEASRNVRRLSFAGCAVRAVLGVPDYGRYLAHLAECHPGARPMSRDEFVAARLRARYERPGSRCC